MIKKEFIVEKSKKIIDVLQDFGFGYVDANKILRQKDVKINGKASKQNVFVEIGDKITVFYSEEVLSKKFDVVFENDNFLIVYKYSGIETAGEKGLESVLKTIAVHRLDRNTEGLVVFAKNEKVADLLVSAFAKRNVKKFYLAEVVGTFSLPDKVYKAFLTKDAQKAEVRIWERPQNGSVEILTKIKALNVGAQSSVLEVELLTGKTHQIRAHLSFLGYPIIGDGKYGKNEINKKFRQKTQKLACFKLKFGYLGVEGLDNQEFIRYPAWYYNK